MPHLQKKSKEKKYRISAQGPQNLYFPRIPGGPKVSNGSWVPRVVDTLTLIWANPLLLNMEVVSKLWYYKATVNSLMIAKPWAHCGYFPGAGIKETSLILLHLPEEAFPSWWPRTSSSLLPVPLQIWHFSLCAKRRKELAVQATCFSFKPQVNSLAQVIFPSLQRKMLAFY